MPSEKFKLKDNHTWKCKPGHSICVIDRGVVRFEYPSNWVVEPEGGAVHLHDRPPSVESCDLGVSLFPVPAEHLRDVDLDEMLLQSLESDRKPHHQSEIHRMERGDMDIAWLEQRYVNTEYHREARFRVALARGAVLCLITMNYWTNRAPGLERVWDEVLRSLMFGDRIADPTKGPVLQ